jgi:hypothetical protein
MSTESSGSSRVAVDLSLAGLSFQVITMTIFCVIFGEYLFRYFRAHSDRPASLRLRLFLGFLCSAVLLILARCAYRVAELHEGYRGEIISDEGLFIALEGVLIVIAVFCLCVGHPGFVFLRNEKGLRDANGADFTEDGIMLQGK